MCVLCKYMETKALLIPLSIIVAGTLIGAGLYFGLRATNPNNAADMHIIAPQALAETKISTQLAPIAALQEQVKRQATALLEEQRAGISSRCWPKGPDAEAIKPLRYMLNFTFAADGSQITRGAATRDRPVNPGLAADITKCVEDVLTPVSVSPPGANIYIETPFQLP